MFLLMKRFLKSSVYSILIVLEKVFFEAMREIKKLMCVE